MTKGILRRRVSENTRKGWTNKIIFKTNKHVSPKQDKTETLLSNPEHTQTILHGVKICTPAEPTCCHSHPEMSIFVVCVFSTVTL